MPDYGMSPGEEVNTRDQGNIESAVRADQNRTEAVKSMNRQRIDSAFPSMQNAIRSSMGSQSTAPNANTTEPR